MRRHRTIPALAVLMTMSACFEGGSNQNQRTPGNQDDGVGLGLETAKRTSTLTTSLPIRWRGSIPSLVTMAHAWKDDRVSTKVSFIDLESGHKHTITVPNCSDEVAVTPDERFAFLAPTTCRRDPVSVIDLDDERWMGNLPGFGPVAVAPRGNVAIAFLDRDNIDADLFDDPEQIPSVSDVRYHVMFIDTVTLEFETLAIGDTLPRYALTPAGNLVLVDSASWYEDGKLRLLNTATKEIHTVSGPDVRLDQFVITSDSLRVFLIDRGLYDLSLWAARVQSVDLPFVPTNINITPDDEHLLLREDATTMWVFRIADQALVHSMRVTGRR